MHIVIILVLAVIVFFAAKTAKLFGGDTLNLGTQPPVPPSNLGPSFDSKVKELTGAIAYHGEGFGMPGALPTRTHNPIDLAIGNKFNLGTQGIEKITVFPDDATGWNAAYQEVHAILSGNSKYTDLSNDFYDLGHNFVDGPNAPVSTAANQWAENVAANLGVDPTTKLGDWLNV
jgi:hypothetical protein